MVVRFFLMASFAEFHFILFLIFLSVWMIAHKLIVLIKCARMFAYTNRWLRHNGSFCVTIYYNVRRNYWQMSYFKVLTGMVMKNCMMQMLGSSMLGSLHNYKWLQFNVWNGNGKRKDREREKKTTKRHKPSGETIFS